tara:strand:- start:1112 stop:2284 length:1173 start_codon:yes stop_codon:yes gene_type:complete
MKKLSLYIIVLFALLNCEKQANHVINGSIDMIGLAENQQVYLYALEDKFLTPIDSVVLSKEGKFTLNIKEPKKGVFHFGSSLRNTFPIVLDSETNEMNLDIKNNQQFAMDYSVSGSKSSAQISEFYNKVYDMMIFNQKKSEERNLVSNNPQSMASIEIQMMKKNQDFLEYRKNYIETNKGSEALIAVIAKIDPNSEMELLKEVAEDINKTLPNSPYATSLNEDIKRLEEQLAVQIEQQKKMDEKMNAMLPIGGMAPELDFPSPNGKNIKLSSLRGKIVLIDFWASWCRPCRAENPNVVRLYNQYKSKGFEVYSFSLDNDKSKWEEAIKADGLVWNSHTSDLKQWQTEAINIYGFGSIPFTVLIDRKGKVLARGLRGVELEEKLNEIFENE